MPHAVTRSTRLAFFAAAGLAIAGCDRSPTGATGPIPTGSTIFADKIGVTDLSTLLAAGTNRITIRVIPGTLTAAAVVVRQGDQIGAPERISSEVTSLTIGTTTDTLTLALGAIQVTFDATTRFEGWRDDRDDGMEDAGEAAFVTRLQASLAAGRPSIELNVNQTNLTINPTPPPDAWLGLLGRHFELRVSDGTTVIHQETPRTKGAIHFEGRVMAVDTSAGTITLADSTVLRIVAGSDIDEQDGDDGHGEDGRHDGHGGHEAHDVAALTTLGAVEAALAAGDTVDAAGHGLLITAAPESLDVIDIRFHIRNQDVEPFVVGFEETVLSADSVAGTFTLESGTLVNVTDSTAILPHDSLTSLGSVALALANHSRVRAEGLAVPVSPGVLNALLLRFEIDDH